MSPIRGLNQANSQTNAPHAQPTPFGGLTRQEKIQSFAKEVLPQALTLGLQASEGLDPKASKTRSKRSSKVGGALGSTGVATTLGGALPLASRWAGLAGGVLGLTDMAVNWGRSTPAQGAASGSAVGAAIGTFFTPGVGTAIGAAIGAVAGGLLGSIKTGKHKDQMLRDAVRSFLVENGVLKPDYSINLADGSRYDLGLDGGPKKELGGRRPFEVDMSNPLAKYAISWMNPVVALFSQGDTKVQSDFTGYFANAVLSNAKNLDDVRKNVDSVLSQFGVNDEMLAKSTIQAFEAGSLDEHTAGAYLNGIQERRGTVPITDEAIEKRTN